MILQNYSDRAEIKVSGGLQECALGRTRRKHRVRSVLIKSYIFRHNTVKGQESSLGKTTKINKQEKSNEKESTYITFDTRNGMHGSYAPGAGRYKFGNN